MSFGQGYAQQREIKQLPTCLDFTEVYVKTVLKTTVANREEEQEMQSLASIMMGYISALQDIYGNRLVGMSVNDNEWTLLDKVAQFCHQHPQMSFQRAVRALPVVAQTIQALQDEEFNRCTNYIDQMRTTICSAVNQKK